MFLAPLTYEKPIPEGDRFVAERPVPETTLCVGPVLLSGRKQPRTAGVMLATAAQSRAIEDNVLSDPFHREGIAEYDLAGRLPTMATPQLGQHLRAPS